MARNNGRMGQAQRAHPTIFSFGIEYFGATANEQGIRIFEPVDDTPPACSTVRDGAPISAEHGVIHPVCKPRAPLPASRAARLPESARAHWRDRRCRKAAHWCQAPPVTWPPLNPFWRVRFFLPGLRPRSRPNPPPPGLLRSWPRCVCKAHQNGLACGGCARTALYPPIPQPACLLYGCVRKLCCWDWLMPVKYERWPAKREERQKFYAPSIFGAPSTLAT